MNCTPVSGEKRFCVVRRVSSRQVACFYISVSFPVNFYHYSLLICELQGWKIKVTQSNVQEAMRKKSKTSMSKDRAADSQHAAKPSIAELSLQLWSNKYSMMLISTGRLNIKVKSSQKVLFSQILKLCTQ